MDEQTLKLKFERASWRKAITFAWSRIPDPLARRELKMIVTKGRNSLSDDKFNEVDKYLKIKRTLFFNSLININII